MIKKSPAMGAVVRPAAARQTPGNPGQDPSVHGNWIQEYKDWSNAPYHGQGPVQKPAMNKESKTLMIPQL